MCYAAAAAWRNFIIIIILIFYLLPRFCFNTCYVGDAGLPGSGTQQCNSGLDSVTSNLLTSDFLNWCFSCVSKLSHACCMPHPFHPIFLYANYIWWTGKNTELKWRSFRSFLTLSHTYIHSYIHTYAYTNVPWIQKCVMRSVGYGTSHLYTILTV
jgi:hypothetical protein